MSELLYVPRDREFPRQHAWVDYHYCWAHSPDKSDLPVLLEVARLAEAELKILHVAEEHALVPEAELKILPVAELQMENPICSCAVVPGCTSA